jgi:transposase-like protein
MISEECALSCPSCGQNSDLFDYKKTRLGIKLPDREFQCPKCGHHFEVVSGGPPTVYPSGLVIPALKKIQPVKNPQF